MGQIFNEFCENFIWTNYGNAIITLLGRDILFFILGYLAHIILETLIEIIKIRRNKK